MKENLPKIIIITLFVLFLGLYTIGCSDYYNYEASNKNRLTEEQIKIFEEDLANNKEVDIDGYINKEEKKYNNIISDTTSGISNTISTSFSKALNFVFTKMSNFVENK